MVQTDYEISIPRSVAAKRVCFSYFVNSFSQYRATYTLIVNFSCEAAKALSVYP
jgi:hypothetical protein